MRRKATLRRGSLVQTWCVAQKTATCHPERNGVESNFCGSRALPEQAKARGFSRSGISKRVTIALRRCVTIKVTNGYTRQQASVRDSKMLSHFARKNAQFVARFSSFDCATCHRHVCSAQNDTRTASRLRMTRRGVRGLCVHGAKPRYGSGIQPFHHYVVLVTTATRCVNVLAQRGQSPLHRGGFGEASSRCATT